MIKAIMCRIPVPRSSFPTGFFLVFFLKGHKLNSLMANMKSSYRIHEHNSDNNDNKINFDK